MRRRKFITRSGARRSVAGESGWQQEPIRPVIGLCRRSPRHRPLAAEGWCSGLGEQSTKWRAK